MHCSFDGSHVESLAHPTEEENETNDENDHNTRIPHDEDVPVAEVAQLPTLKNEIKRSQNSRNVSINPDIKNPGLNHID